MEARLHLNTAMCMGHMPNKVDSAIIHCNAASETANPQQHNTKRALVFVIPRFRWLCHT